VRAPEDLFYVLEVEIMFVPVGCAFVLVPLELCETGLLDESRIHVRDFGTAALRVYTSVITGSKVPYLFF
jgi:hypothetical protein